MCMVLQRALLHAICAVLFAYVATVVMRPVTMLGKAVASHVNSVEGGAEQKNGRDKGEAVINAVIEPEPEIEHDATLDVVEPDVGIHALMAQLKEMLASFDSTSLDGIRDSRAQRRTIILSLDEMQAAAKYHASEHEAKRLQLVAAKFSCGCSNCPVAIDAADAFYAYLAEAGAVPADVTATHTLLQAFALYDEAVELNAVTIHWIANMLAIARGDMDATLAKIDHACTAAHAAAKAAEAAEAAQD